jgi:type II secretory pathway pseudopilin PulG
VKTFHFIRRNGGMTLIEVLLVIVSISIFVLMIASNAAVPRAKARALRIQCANNLKQVGSDFYDWAGDHGGKYPFEISQTNGGTREFTTGANAYRHFVAMSNELSAAKILVCPADAELARTVATNFSFLSNSNLSCFVGVNAIESDPQGILSGDHNITNGTPLKNGVLELTANHAAGWAADLHGKVGNILLADGTVQQETTTGLRAAVTNDTKTTNRLQMPILGP